MTELAQLTFSSVFQYSREKFRDNYAFSYVDGTPISFAEFGEKVEKISGILQSRGISPGDRVAILSENQPNWPLAYFAVTAMGAVVVPILPDFHVNEIHHIIRHSKCKAIFVSEKLFSNVEEIKSDSIKTIMYLNNFQLIPTKDKRDLLKEVSEKGSKELKKLRKTADSKKQTRKVEIKEDDLASIIYTSGTTGHSKGVMLTHRNIVSNALSGLNIYDVTNTDRFLSILPLSHAYEGTIGMLCPFIKGACVYYLDKLPTPRILMDALNSVKPTFMLSVPLVIEKIFKTRIVPQLTKNKLMRGLYKIQPVRKKLHVAAGKKLYESLGGKLKFLGIGGALLSPEVEKFLIEADFPFAIGYGLTETSPLVAASDIEHRKFRSTGPAVKNVSIKIDQPDEQTGEGEILVKGPNVMKGYYNDRQRTAAVLTKDGWFRTGDLGVIDKDGYLFIKGRIKNMIVGPSGENIYPEEIESIINEYDFVLESLVYEHHAKITARVFLNYEEIDKKFSSSDFDESQLQTKVQELLTSLKEKVNARVSSYSRISKIIEQTEPFEKTPTQKTKRYLYVD